MNKRAGIILMVVTLLTAWAYANMAPIPGNIKLRDVLPSSQPTSAPASQPSTTPNASGVR